jgi:hypothetical protein
MAKSVATQPKTPCAAASCAVAVHWRKRTCCMRWLRRSLCHQAHVHQQSFRRTTSWPRRSFRRRYQSSLRCHRPRRRRRHHHRGRMAAALGAEAAAEGAAAGVALRAAVGAAARAAAAPAAPAAAPVGEQRRAAAIEVGAAPPRAVIGVPRGPLRSTKACTTCPAPPRQHPAPTSAFVTCCNISPIRHR